jgi:hypothetical protein
MFEVLVDVSKSQVPKGDNAVILHDACALQTHGYPTTRTAVITTSSPRYLQHHSGR